ncbi:hypothetical protein BDN70DRAFT_80852 [Pholiota conissans]|uniref:CCHC-type domain-containing protein n=1 Tax=Pholiota conissans TaxID=109636 RepID=A0A9P5ZCZ2_9AGAR|nr:hypothetical protein BDN70DRAFT_80852 [Pholiota conissans]
MSLLMHKSDRKVCFSQSPGIGTSLVCARTPFISANIPQERLSTGYHQYPGPRAGKVEEEVCLLDPRAAPRRQGNCKGTLGRERSPPGAQRMGFQPTATTAGRDGQGQSEITPSFFYHPTPDLLPHGWEPYGIYHRAEDDILGADVEPSEGGEPEDRSRCFNCGDPNHKISECHFRLNRELIALARQYYQFYQPNSGLGWKRIHAVEAWRQQRLDWLEEFEPGKIKGELLKEALSADYANEDEWLKNISVWGYPRGWLSESDPRERVKLRIWNENEGEIIDGEDDDVPFEIHGDDVVETVSFQDAFRIIEHGQKPQSPSPKRSASESTLSGCGPSSSKESVRWADYPSSYFSSQHLVLYEPPPPKESWPSTIFENTDAYLHQFYQLPPHLHLTNHHLYLLHLQFRRQDPHHYLHHCLLHNQMQLL